MRSFPWHGDFNTTINYKTFADISRHKIINEVFKNICYTLVKPAQVAQFFFWFKLSLRDLEVIFSLNFTWNLNAGTGEEYFGTVANWWTIFWRK
jgi:hypothetical protein